MKGLHMTFAMAVAMAGAATLIGAAQPWFRLKVPDPASASERKLKESDTRKAEEKVDGTISVV